MKGKNKTYADELIEKVQKKNDANAKFFEFMEDVKDLVNRELKRGMDMRSSEGIVHQLTCISFLEIFSKAAYKDLSFFQKIAYRNIRKKHKMALSFEKVKRGSESGMPKT